MSDDIKVDDEVKKAEADMMAPKDSLTQGHLNHISAHRSILMQQLAEEQRQAQERYEAGLKREMEKKKYFEECGLEWNEEVANLCDTDMWFSMSYDIESYKKKVDILADWFKKNSTKLGGLL